MRRTRRENVAWVLALSLILTFAIPGFIGQALAAQQDVTTRWNIAQDTSFSVTFIPAHTRIDFDPSTGTFTDLKCTDQTDAQWCYRITNDGNVNIDIAANFTADFPSGVTEFRTCTASSSDACSGSNWFWTDTNETTQNTIVSGLTPSSTADRWAFTTGSGVAAGTYDRVYRLISTAV